MFWNRLNEKNESIWIPIEIENEGISSALTQIRKLHDGLDFSVEDTLFTQLDFYKFSKDSPFGSRGKAYAIRILFEAHTEDPDQNEYLDKTTAIYFMALVGKKKVEVLHLNGESPAIHKANALIHPSKDGSKGNHAISLPKATDYLDFFTSFVSGDEGPFIEIKSPDRDIYYRDSDIELFSYYERNERLRQFYGNHESHLEGIPKTFLEIRNFVEIFLTVYGKYKNNIDVWEEFRNALPKDESVTKDHTELSTNNSKDFDKESDQEFEVDWIKFGKEYKAIKVLKQNPWTKVFLQNSKKIKNELIELIDQYFDKDSGESIGLKTIGLVQYGQGLFIALYKVPENGVVEMLIDITIDGRTETNHALPIGKWTFEKIPKLADLKSLTFTDFSENSFERKLEEATIPLPILIETTEPKDKKKFFQSSIKVTNGYQKALSRKWVEQKLHHSLDVNGISFKEQVDLSGIEVDGHLIFKNCKFLKPLFLSQATIHGSLIFENCTFYGIPTQNNDPSYIQIALGLENINIKGEFKILDSQSLGSVDMRRSNVDLSAKIRGLEVFPHFNEYQKDQFDSANESKEKFQIDKRFIHSGVALDLRYSKFNRGLDLSANFSYDYTTTAQFQKNNEDDSETEKSNTPNKIAGYLVLDNSFIDGPLFLSGLIISSPNKKIFNPVYSYYLASFNNCTINGDVLIWRPIEIAGYTFKYMRTYIERGFEFKNSNVRGNIDLRSIWIGGSLKIENTNCRGNVNLESLTQYIMDHGKQAVPYKIEHVQGKPKYQFPAELQIKIKNEWFLGSFGRTNILKNLSLKGSNIDGVVYLKGTNIGMKAVFENGIYGSIRFGAVIDQLEFSKAINRCPETLAQLDADPPHFSEDYQYLDESPHWLRYVSETHEHCIFSKNLKNFEFTLDHTVTKFCDSNGFSKISTRLESAKAGYRGLLITKSRFHQLILKNSTINGSAFISHTLAIGSKSQNKEVNALINNSISEIDFNHKAIEIENVTIDGQLSFFEDSYIENEIDSILDQNAYRYEAVFPHCFIDKGENENEIDVDKIKKELRISFEKSRMKDSTIAVGNLKIKNVTIDDDLNLTHLKVAGKAELIDVIAKSSVLTDSSLCDPTTYMISKEISIDLLRSEGNLSLNKIKAGHLVTKNTTVGGHFLISDVTVRSRRSSPERKENNKSDFIIQNSSIQGQFDFKGDLKIENGKFDLTDVDVFGNISTNKNEDLIDLEANKVKLELLRLQGSFLLPRLSIKNEFRIYNSEIGGDFDFIKYGKGGNIGENLSILMTNVKGFLRLAEPDNTNISIGQNGKKPIDFSSSSFGKANIPIRKSEEGNVQDGRWILQHAKFEHLNVIDSSVWNEDKKAYNRKSNSLVESEIDFRGSKIERLSFNEKEGFENGKIASDIEHISGFLDMGNRTSGDFSLEGYANVEAYLRKQGRKQDSNKIYAIMQERWRQFYLIAPIKSPFSLLNPLKGFDNLVRGIIWFFHFFIFAPLTQFGSNWIRPLILIGCLFVISLLNFTLDVSNWEAYTLNERNGKYELSENGVNEIGFFGTLKSLEITTPTISLITDYTYDEVKYVFKKENNRWVILMKALGWLFWPAFLLSVTGVLRRN